MRDAPIVVGIEDTTAAAEALRWAAEESQKTEAPLVAVHAYVPGDTDRESRELAATRESVARSWATHWVRDTLADGAALPWRTQLVVVAEGAGSALVRFSRDAALLVLGRSSEAKEATEARVAEPAEEPVTEHCCHEATCPVVIMPALDDADPRPRPARVSA